MIYKLKKMSKRSSSVTKTNDLSSDNNSAKISESDYKFDFDKKSKRKKVKKRATKIKVIDQPIIKKKIEPIVINDLIDRNISFFKLKQKIKPIIIYFIYRRDKTEIKVGHKANFGDLKEKISRIINIPIDDININLKDYKEQINDTDLIQDIIKNVKYPIFFVKKKNYHFSLLSQIYSKNYKNKVIIEGIKDKNDLKLQIETFFNNSLINKDNLYEPITENKYSIGFTSPNIAFDFQRFLIILRFTNSLYYDIKSTFKNENSKKKNNEINKFKHIRYSSSPYINISTPYISYEEIRRKEEIENKKKWICNKNFFSAVGSHSDRYLTEYYDYQSL